MMTASETFTPHRPLLFAIAYRMLGSVMDAEDMVQETYLRWERASDVRSAKSYLSTIITRLCIDYLRSARVQREEYVGQWLPEPLLTEEPPDMADKLAQADSLSMAFLVILESLQPAERAAFLLREVFDYDYAEIAAIVEKTEADCRQMVSRARRRVRERRPRFDTSESQVRLLTERFMDVASGGNMEGLLQLLAEDVTAYSDGGGKAGSAINPIYGRDKVSRFIRGLVRKVPDGYDFRFAQVNGLPGIINYIDGNPQSVVTLDTLDGKVRAIHAVVNPDKLQRIPPLSTGGDPSRS